MLKSNKISPEYFSRMYLISIHKKKSTGILKNFVSVPERMRLREIIFNHFTKRITIIKRSNTIHNNNMLQLRQAILAANLMEI